ncbi:MAG: Brp/Blh family beta-carotene 15,15'-dioxygenase [Methylophilaceae bacterium]|nr:Brp/Blh family beta-carotene 15,15'-dioxygenase [Methylophilaceae bacterium]
MNKYMQLQSNLFILMSGLAALFGAGLDHHTSLYLLLITTSCVVILGVPHGALDVLFASQTFALKTLAGWGQFILYYLIAALAFILVWLWMPNLFFISFLILSALHFSEDLNYINNRILKFSYGAVIITLPSLRFGPALIDLYAMVIEIEAATRLVKLSQLISVSAALIIAIQLLNNRIAIRTKLEMLCACVLFLLLNPLLAFGIYFCVMHSARHLIRSRFFLPQFSRQAFLNALFFPTIAVIIIGLLIWWLGPKKPLEVDIIRIVFIGLAALTVPHAWVLQRANFNGWSSSKTKAGNKHVGEQR